MDQGGMLEFVIAGLAGLLVISLMFWIGHALLRWLEYDTPPESGFLHNVPDQPAYEIEGGLPIQAGHERLATETERNDINARIERTHSTAAPTSGQL